MSRAVLNAELAARVLDCWGLRLARVRPDLAVSGSPERSHRRAVVEDDRDRLLILEELAEANAGRKRVVNRAIRYLWERGLRPVVPRLECEPGESVAQSQGSWWQLRPFVNGDDLPRPGYVQDEWRGQAAGEFLNELQRRSQGIESLVPHRVFDFPAYARRVAARAVREVPGTRTAVTAFVDHLEQGLFREFAELPATFAHGDFHPMNVLWKDRGMAAVIDWEFCGFRPQAYDAALFVGCIGMEEPDGLYGPLCRALIRTANASEPGWPQQTRESFLDLLFMIRFGWLREWLVRDDREALDLELCYMGILLEWRGELLREWMLAD